MRLRQCPRCRSDIHKIDYTIKYTFSLMDRHMELLEADELDVRISAGENIALFLEDHEENIKKEGGYALCCV